jgi:hypothetical protein
LTKILRAKLELSLGFRNIIKKKKLKKIERPIKKILKDKYENEPKT